MWFATERWELDGPRTYWVRQGRTDRLGPYDALEALAVARTLNGWIA